MAVETKVTYCRICEPLCGLIATVDDGTVTQLRPDPDHPLSRGQACPKGIAFVDIQNDPDRVLHPLRRTESGEFERVSWDDALADIAARLKKLPPNSVGGYLGNPPAFSYSHSIWFAAFLRAFGTKHFYSAGSQDINSRFAASALLYGAVTQLPFPDLPRTDFLLILGANPLVSHGSALNAPRIKDQLSGIAKRGGRVVVVDPRHTETAKAHEHVFVRPDTDAWLLLSMLHVIFGEGLADDAALREQSVGADAWRSRRGEVRARGHCGDHRRASRRRAEPRARFRDRAERDGVRTHRLLPWTSRHAGRSSHRHPGDRHRQPGPARWHLVLPWRDPVRGVGRKVRIGDVRSRSLAGRRLHRRPGKLPGRDHGRRDRHPGGWATARALRRGRKPGALGAERAEARRGPPALDLMVSVDLYVNETNRNADYILPATTWLEREDFPIAVASAAPTPFIQMSEAVVPPRGEARQEWEVYDEIARRMGLDLFLSGPLKKLAPVTTRLPRLVKPRSLAEALLRIGPHGDRFGLRRGGLNRKKLRKHPHGIVLDEFAATGLRTHAVRHKGGKVRLDAPELLAEVGRLGDRHVDDPAHPLRMIGLRELRSHNSWMHNSANLMKGANRTHRARINPADAADVGVVDGAAVRIRSPFGQIETVALLTDEVGPGTVAVPHGWGHDGGSWELANKAGGANVNELASSEHDDVERLAGMSHLNGIPVAIERV